jgi:hypothetical protein
MTTLMVGIFLYLLMGLAVFISGINGGINKARVIVIWPLRIIYPRLYWRFLTL